MRRERWTWLSEMRGEDGVLMMKVERVEVKLEREGSK